MRHDDPTRRRPTLSEVAELAGVSVKTASRAINHEPNVAPSTGQRVKDAADLLGYRRNGLARELRRGATSSLVGLVGGDLADPFHSAVASGVERELRQHGLLLVTANDDGDAEREQNLVDAFLERRVGALLIMGGGDDARYRSIERTHGVPLVFVDRRPAGTGDAVVIDNAGGARAAAEHLLARGHLRIALVAGPTRAAAQRSRIAGFRAAMRAAGVTAWQRYARTDVSGVGHAERTVRELLEARPAPTAVFAAGNRLTTGTLRAMRELVDPPALVGFDDFDLADVLGTTVVAHDATAMGREAARLAYRRITGHTSPARTIVMSTSIIARGSGERPPPCDDDRT
jgi:LacI family transcriptional regulator